jgi:transcriptional regulator with XRE-family HTH domain
MTSQAPGPTLRQRRIARELRRLRAASGLTLEQVSETTGLSAATISRIENREVKPRRPNVKALLDAYLAPEVLAIELLQWTRDVGGKGWWHTYGDNVMSAPYKNLIALEQEASHKRSFEPLYIPGLLQTAAYMQATSQAVRPDLSAEALQEGVEVRLKRQARLGDLQFCAVVLEEVLRRRVGGREVMQAQLQHILEMTEGSKISVRLITLEAGAHAGMEGGFSLLRFEDSPEDDFVYLETASGEVCFEDADRVSQFRSRLDSLEQVSLSQTRSRQLVGKVLEEFK